MDDETLQDKTPKAEDKLQPVTALPKHADAMGLEISRAGLHISIPVSRPPAT